MITYDICDDRRRRIVDHYLQKYGQRIQKSVFECLLEAWQLRDLHEQLTGFCDAEVDSLRFYPLCAGCQKDIRWQGCADAPDTQSWYHF